MTAFFLTAGAMLALALVFVLPTLLGNKHEKPNGTAAYAQRNGLNLTVLQDQLRELDVDLQKGTIELAPYRHARQELERHIAENANARHSPAQAEQAGKRRSWSALVIAFALPLAATFFYALLGTPKALLSTPTVQAESDPATGAAQIEAMVSRLAARLKANPNDADGWRMLARSYDTMRHFDFAVDAYKHLIALEPNNADALTDYAVTLAMSMNQNLSGEPERLIERALSIDPSHIQALALSGSVAYERGEYAKAIGPWKKILTIVPADADIAQSIAASVSKAESLAATASK